MATEPAFQLSEQPGAVDMQGCRSLVREQRYDEARDALTQLLSREPNNIKALELMSRVVQRLARTAPEHEQAWRNSIPYLEKVVELEPRRADTRMSLARLYRRAREFPKAFASLQAINELEPGNLEIAEMLANWHIKRGQHDLARPIVEAAIRHNPDSHSLLTMKARLESQVGDTEAAEGTLRQILAGNPRSIGHQIQLVQLLLGENRLDEAQQILNDLPQKSSFGPMRYLLTGEILFRQGKFDDAIIDFKASLLNTPSGHEAVARLTEKVGEGEQGGMSEVSDMGGEDIDRSVASASVRADSFRSAARRGVRNMVRGRRSKDNAASPEPSVDDDIEGALEDLLG